MALANGSYQITVTATRKDGLTNTYTSFVNIGDGVFLLADTISDPSILHGAQIDVNLEVGSISSESVPHSPSIEFTSPVVSILESITNSSNVLGMVTNIKLVSISSYNQAKLGSPMVVTTIGEDLTTFSNISLFVDSTLIGSGYNTTTNTSTFNLPADGFKPNSNYNIYLVLTK